MKQRALLRTGVRGNKRVLFPSLRTNPPPHDLDGQFLPNVSYTYTPISFQRALREDPPPRVPYYTTNQWDSLRPTQLCSKMFSLSKERKNAIEKRNATLEMFAHPKERRAPIVNPLFEVVLLYTAPLEEGQEREADSRLFC